jgi:hypothetical protein
MTAPRCTEQLWAIEHGKLVCDHSLPCPFHGTTEDQWPSCCGLPMLAYDAKEYRCPDCKRAIPIAPLARAPLTGATVAAICDKHDEALTYLASAPARDDAGVYAIMWAQRGKSGKIMGVGVAPVWYDTRAGADSLAKAYNDDAGPGMRYTVVAVGVPNVE